MKKQKYLYLPTATDNSDNIATIDKEIIVPPVMGDSPCPCCGYITIPNHGDALAYICPVCFWEIDLFIQSDNEPSDQNHGLTLQESKNNYMKFGAVLLHLKQYCRNAKDHEQPIK